MAALPPAVRHLFKQAQPDRLPAPGFFSTLAVLGRDTLGIQVVVRGKVIKVTIDNPRVVLRGELWESKKGLHTIAHGLPPDVADSLRDTIATHALAFPWESRDLTRDLVWWGLIRGHSEAMEREQARGTVFFVKEGASAREYARAERSMFDVDARAIVLSPAAWTARISAAIDSDIARAIESNQPGQFWLSWL